MSTGVGQTIGPLGGPDPLSARIRATLAGGKIFALNKLDERLVRREYQP
jgi:hypothetical protein